MNFKTAHHATAEILQKVLRPAKAKFLPDKAVGVGCATYLALDLGYGAQEQVLLALVALLADAEHDNVSARLQCFPLGLRDQFVFADAFCQFGGAQHGVLLLVDDLVGALVHTIVAIVDHIFWRVSFRQVLPEPTV